MAAKPHLSHTQYADSVRRRLKGDEALLDFPVCRELRDQGGTDYIAWLIPFARTGEPGPHAVLANGGEVLRFIGDAVLAIFPIRDGNAQAACELAMAAVHDAEARLKSVNEQRDQVSLESLDYGLGLHVGDVMFGNIGVTERLEFSVIGSAANEVARIESLTKTLGHRAGQLRVRPLCFTLLERRRQTYSQRGGRAR